MSKMLLLLSILIMSQAVYAQDVDIDGRLKPHLDEFFALCKKYDIPYHDKLFELKYIDVVEDLHTSAQGSTLGMLRRDNDKKVEGIAINWVAMLDPQILKVVSFHEFGHYFLGYDQHVCDDCGIIMSVVNSSYFDIANDWEQQLKILFEQSPVYIKTKQNSSTTLARTRFPDK